MTLFIIWHPQYGVIYDIADHAIEVTGDEGIIHEEVVEEKGQAASQLSFWGEEVCLSAV